MGPARGLSDGSGANYANSRSNLAKNMGLGKKAQPLNSDKIFDRAELSRISSATIHKRTVGWGIDLGKKVALAMGSVNIAFRAQLVVPEQRQLYDYWLARSESGLMPKRADINPADIPRLLPFISLIDVGDKLEQSRVRLAGTRLRERVLLRHHRSAHRRPGPRPQARLLDDRLPPYRGGRKAHAGDRPRPPCQQGTPGAILVRLPLADASGAVRMILGLD